MLGRFLMKQINISVFGGVALFIRCDSRSLHFAFGLGDEGGHLS